MSGSADLSCKPPTSSDIGCAASNFGLHKDTVNTLKSKISCVLAMKIGGYITVNNGRCNTIWGDEFNLLTHPLINVDKQPVQHGASLSHTMSAHTLGLCAEVPHGMESARTSVTTLDTTQILPPPSAASTVTSLVTFSFVAP
ncbi:hypothetical protein BDR05DRAFT_1004707 [Suillus weaverae]|nr:hypothetical protein BDR05DRAFT_1004707 [Suillus weaverae]